MVTLYEFERDIDRFLLELKLVIDSPALLRRSELNSAQASGEIQALLEIEKARMFVKRFLNQARRGKFRDRSVDFHDLGDVRSAVSYLIEYLRDYFKLEDQFHNLRRVTTFRIRSPRFSSFAAELAVDFLPTEPLEFLRLIEFYINHVQLIYDNTDVVPGSSITDGNAKAAFAGMLQKIVPVQQAAPAQFEVRNSKVVVVHANKPPQDTDLGNAAAALDHLKTAGENLVQSLLNSNCDGRLLTSVQDLRSQLASNENIVKLGLANLASETMCDEFRAELPDAIAAMFRSFTTAISQYVAQFPDWQRFTQNAIEIQLDSANVDELAVAADSVLAAIGEAPELSDPEVPKTLKLIKELLKDPKLSLRRGAFAVIKTLENFVSAICSYASKFVSETMEKSLAPLSTVASRTIVGLLSLAIIGASGVGPAAAAVGIPWVQKAGELAESLTQQIKSELSK